MEPRCCIFMYGYACTCMALAAAWARTPSGLKVRSLRSQPLVVVVRAEPAMHDLQVLHGGSTSHVEEVVANTAVARTAALAPAEMSQAVLHGDALADSRTSVAGLGKSAETLLQELAVGD